MVDYAVTIDMREGGIAKAEIFGILLAEENLRRMEITSPTSQ
jgi:hypothetical protein